MSIDYVVEHRPMKIPRGVQSRLGITAEEYLRRQAAGEKWCTGCKAWHLKSEFSADRTRPDGLRSMCREAASEAHYTYLRRSKPPLRYFDCSNGCIVRLRDVQWKDVDAFCPECGQMGCVYDTRQAT